MSKSKSPKKQHTSFLLFFGDVFVILKDNSNNDIRRYIKPTSLSSKMELLCEYWDGVQLQLWRVSGGFCSILRPAPNDRHFTDDIFRCITFNENRLLLISNLPWRLLMVKMTMGGSIWVGDGMARDRPQAITLPIVDQDIWRPICCHRAPIIQHVGMYE